MGDEFYKYELDYLQAVHESSDEFIYDDEGLKRTSLSVKSSESEQSYKVIFTRYDVLDFITFLTFDVTWLLTVAVCNLIVFITLTYHDIFINEDEDTFELNSYIALTICYSVFFLDIVSSAVHFWSPFTKRKCYRKKSLPFVLLDLISLVVLALHLMPVVGIFIFVRFMSMLILVYKLHEIVEYFATISKLATMNNVAGTMRKYGLFYALIVHVFTLVWYSVGCHLPPPACPDDESWTSSLKQSSFNVTSDTRWYVICLYIMMNAFTSTGIGMMHSYTNLEAFLLTIISLLGLSLLNGVFLGACTSVQVETYRRHSEYSEKIKMIQSKFSTKRLSRPLCRKIMQYYITCWIQLGGVIETSHWECLPTALSMQITYDKYCNALNSCHLFRHAHESIKRAISTIMQTEIFIQGEVIFRQGVLNQRMIYLARGSVQILSGTDEESPIISLEMGSVIGEMTLLLNVKSPVKIIASSYCVIHSIHKHTLWVLLNSYRKLKGNKSFHNILKSKIDFAHRGQNNKSRQQSSKAGGKTLKIMKNKLQTSRKWHNKLMEHESQVDFISDIYILNKQTTALRHADDICLKTSFPWILRADSSLLMIWDTIIVIFALTVGVVYPYAIGFEKDFTTLVRALSYFVDVAFLSDVIIQLFTAVENDEGVQTTMSEIFAIKIRSLGFLTDIFSVFPISVFITIFRLNYVNRILICFQFNRIFKLYKVATYLSKLENSFKINVGIIRGVKYVMTYVFLSYLIGTILYMESCFYDVCDGWYHNLAMVDEEQIAKRTESPFYVSLSFVMLLISQTGFGGIYATNYNEMLSMVVTNISSVLTFTYLVADYSATLSLANLAFNRFSQMVLVIRKFMENNNLPESLRNRTNEYLAAQWRYCHGLISEEFMTELPQYTFEQQRSAKYAYLFESCPLFKGMDAPFFTMLASKCTLEMLPPNEIVKYAGETTRQMFVIQSGYCVVISAISGKEEKIIGPGGHVYDFEMVLEKPGIFNVKTLTHVSFLKLTTLEFNNVLKFYPDFKEDLRLVVEEVKSGLAIQRIFVASREVAYQQLVEEENKSWFIFPNRKLNSRNIDYLNVFSTMGIWKFTKLLLLRRTIMPFGNFMLLWEFGRGVVAFIAVIMYPTVLLQQTYLAYFRYYMSFMDVIGIVDMYVRLHVCYYDKRGVLVTHPKLTSLYYLSHSFVIDLLSIIPADLLLKFIYTVDKKTISMYLRVEALMRFHKLLTLYRFPCAFYYFRKDIFKSETLIQSTVKYIVYSLVFFNVATILLILISCNVEMTSENLIVLIPKTPSWITYQDATYSFDIKEPFNLYVTSFFFVSGIALSVNFGDLVPATEMEMALVICLLVVGYFFFTYVFVIISNCRSNLNLNLTMYQQRMTRLIQYMKEEDIDKGLQRKAISHFEYNWQRTHGMKASVVMKKCHVALREDCVLYLYERTLCEVQILAEQSQAFYRYLGLHVEEAYFLRDFPIIRLNDVVDTIFIIHKGAVDVQGPDGSHFETLERGCVFGNMDDVSHARSMVTVVASKAVDLLCIKTSTFYSIIKDYPTIKHKLQKCLLLENLCYIANQKTKVRKLMKTSVKKVTEKVVVDNEDKSLWKIIKEFVCSSQINLGMMICSYISVFVVTHHAAFLNHYIWTFVLTYFFDIVHLIKFIASFYTPFVDSMGEVITDPSWIVDKYIHSLQFYVDIFGLLPLEIFCFVSSDSRLYYLAILRLNRCIRLFNVFQFFHKSKDYLNVNIMLVRLSKIFLFLTAVLHIVSSLLYMFACPKGVCNSGDWLIGESGEEICDYHYLCSFYYVTSIVTFSAYGDLTPRSVLDLIITCTIIVGSKFLVASFAGDMSAMLNNISSALVEYDYNLKKFHIFLRKHNISSGIIKRAMDYSYQLWTTNRGVQMPKILHEAPAYIMEELMGAAYGKHLAENFVFCQCHKDFLRLLTAKLKVYTYYTADNICYQGEVNDTMYFIHKGMVEVYAVSETEETQVDVLNDLDCFGMIQGLFKETPHTHTYISASVTVIVTLTLKDWQHLLLFYPASKFQIYKKIQLT